MATVAYSKPKLIYEGFVDGFLRVGRRDYVPISSIILVIHNRGNLAKNLKKAYVARGRFINIAREEKVRCYLLVGLKGDSFCISSPLDPVNVVRYITQWRLGKEVKDEDPWSGLREKYSVCSSNGEGTDSPGEHSSEGEGDTTESTDTTDMVQDSIGDL